MNWVLQEALRHSTSTVVEMMLVLLSPDPIGLVHYRIRKTYSIRLSEISGTTHHIHPGPYTCLVQM
jgi:hypothetical protein